MQITSTFLSVNEEPPLSMEFVFLIDCILTQADVKILARGHKVEKHHSEGNNVYDVLPIQTESGNGTKKILGKNYISK